MVIMTVRMKSWEGDGDGDSDSYSDSGSDNDGHSYDSIVTDRGLHWGNYGCAKATWSFVRALCLLFPFPFVHFWLVAIVPLRNNGIFRGTKV